MARYRFYRLQGCALAGLDEIEVGDDAEAERRARQWPGPGVVEIWRDHRKIRTVPAGT